MAVDWNGYEPCVPPHRGLLAQMPRRDARECYDHLMAARPERREQLCKLLKANRVSLSGDHGLDDLESWFRASLERNPADPQRLANLWYAVVNDIGLFLGDVAIEHNPSLHWEFFTRGAKDAAYQRHVIMGFAGVANPKYNVDFDLLVATMGHRLIGGLGTLDRSFVTWVTSLGEKV